MLRAGLANSVRKQCRAAGVVDTAANLWKFYVNKCRNNLHLVLAMSPSGDKLRLRCRSFPGLISNCVIDWFFPWFVKVRKSIVLKCCGAVPALDGLVSIREGAGWFLCRI